MPYIQVEDINIFYRVVANSEEQEFDPSLPTMIVHHGGFGIIDHQLEFEAWKPLSTHCQLVYIDQRGCGRSEDGVPSKWTMDQLGGDIFNFCQAMGIEHPIVSGVSSGGYAAIAYATRHPGHCRGLVLLNTEPVVSPEKKREAYAAQGTRVDRKEFAPFKDLDDAQIVDYANAAASAAYEYDLDPSDTNLEEFAKRGYSTIRSYALTR